MSSGVLAVLVVAAWYRRCSDAASTCPSKDDYYNAQRQFRATPLRLYLIIPKSMTETALCKRLELFGPLEYVSVVKDKVTGTNRGFGYIKFFQFSQAAKAFKGCDPNYKPKFADHPPRWEDRRPTTAAPPRLNWPT